MDQPETTGPPDRQTLRLLERQLSDDELIEGTTFDPDTNEPRLCRAQLDVDRYPTSVTGIRLDIRWFESGDFSIHYRETHAEGGTWECRWDRHPNEHNTRLHFHQPPDAREVIDIEMDSLHPLDVYSTVLSALEQRLETHWDA